jgi:hypothetical protein
MTMYLQVLASLFLGRADYLEGADAALLNLHDAYAALRELPNTFITQTRG